MRTLALPLTALLLALGLVVVAVQARGEGEATDPTAEVKLLKEQVRALRADTELLFSREAALTKYLLSMHDAAANLHKGAENARSLGFDAAAFPANSRTSILVSLERLAKDLSNALPAPTQQEKDLARRADELRKVAFPR